MKNFKFDRNLKKTTFILTSLNRHFVSVNVVEEGKVFKHRKN